VSPGNVVAAFMPALRRRYDKIPMLNLDSDSFIDDSRDMKLAPFMWQVKQRRDDHQGGLRICVRRGASFHAGMARDAS